MKFLIVVEKTRTGFSAYSPDLPGCVATAPSKPRVATAIKKALRFHLQGMRAEGLRVPSRRTWSFHVDVPA